MRTSLECFFLENPIGPGVWPVSSLLCSHCVHRHKDFFQMKHWNSWTLLFSWLHDLYQPHEWVIFSSSKWEISFIYRGDVAEYHIPTPSLHFLFFIFWSSVLLFSLVRHILCSQHVCDRLPFSGSYRCRISTFLSWISSTKCCIALSIYSVPCGPLRRLESGQVPFAHMWSPSFVPKPPAHLGVFIWNLNIVA